MTEITTAPDTLPDAVEDIETTTETLSPPRVADDESVLITEQEVLFGSAPALTSPRRTIFQRIATRRARSRHYVAREPEYMERARMSREMYRL
jgi:hypothetical protein